MMFGWGGMLWRMSASVRRVSAVDSFDLSAIYLKFITKYLPSKQHTHQF